jgi:hypothetical protein
VNLAKLTFDNPIKRNNLSLSTLSKKNGYLSKYENMYVKNKSPRISILKSTGNIKIINIRSGIFFGT